MTLSPPTSPSPYDHSVTFKATLKSLGVPANGQIVFTVGSQRQAAQTVGGSATTQMVIQELPGTYTVTAAFAETSTLLGSSASATMTVTKKATSLAFGATPFLVTLTDADGNLLRDETVFFNVTSGSARQTVAVQTSRDGVAQLRGLTVPSGTYTVTAYFLGQIPYGAGLFATVTDDRYNPSSVRSTLVFNPNPPSCDLTNAGIDDQGRRFIEVTVRDAVSGLASVSTTEMNNLTVNIPTFANGLQTALIVRATKVDQSQSSQLGLEVVNVAGKITDCDPVAVVLGGRGESRSTTVENVVPEEHFVVVYNGDPGIRSLRVRVNRHTWQINGLRPGEVRTLDIAQALKANGRNTVTLTAQGPALGTALVLISDRAPASAIVRHAQAERSAPTRDADGPDDNDGGR